MNPVLVVNPNSFTSIALRSMMSQYQVGADSELYADAAFERIKRQFERYKETYKLILFDDMAFVAIKDSFVVNFAEKVKAWLKDKAPKLEPPMIVYL